MHISLLRGFSFALLFGLFACTDGSTGLQIPIGGDDGGGGVVAGGGSNGGGIIVSPDPDGSGTQPSGTVPEDPEVGGGGSGGTGGSGETGGTLPSEGGSDGQIPLAEPVPEPVTMLLFGSGLAGVAFTYRRRQRKSGDPDGNDQALS